MMEPNKYMALENEWYVQSGMMLKHGVSYITMEMMQRELKKRGCTLDEFLAEKRHVLGNRRHLEMLFSCKTDMINWDAQTLSRIILILFGDSLLCAERHSFSDIIQLNHQLDKSTTKALSFKEYNAFVNTLYYAIKKLASPLDNPARDKCTQILNDYKICPLGEKTKCEEQIITESCKILVESIMRAVTPFKWRPPSKTTQKIASSVYKSALSSKNKRVGISKEGETCIKFDIESLSQSVTAGSSMIDQKKLNMMWKGMDENKGIIYKECELISQYIENMSSSIMHVWPAYDTNANDDIVFVVLTTRKFEADLRAKQTLEKTGYNVFVTYFDSCSKESEQVLQKIDQLETNQCFSKLEDLGSVINKHSDRLLRNHQYLSAILGSNVRSERFSLGQSEHLVSFQPCIVLYVFAKGKIPLHESRFEDNLDGIPVDVREGLFQRTTFQSETHSKPVKMGCQITSNTTPPDSFGTLGGFFYHNDYGFCGVTCAHVVLDEAMLQDLRGEKKVFSKEESIMVFHPNTTQHKYELGHVKEAVYRTGSESSSGIDIAIFKIEEMCFETGRTLGTSDLKYGTRVLKFGRTTAWTTGYIEFENTTVRMIKFERKYTHGSSEYTFLLKNQIAVRPDLTSSPDVFNDYGDSGAFVFVKDSDNQLVCIGICVGKLDKLGIVIPLSAVKRDLGISNFYEFRWNRFSDDIKEMNKKLDEILLRLPTSSS